jgi:hypothetical protein
VLLMTSKQAPSSRCAALCCAFITSLAACATRTPCSPDFEQGDRIEVTVVARWEPPGNTDLLSWEERPLPSCSLMDVAIGDSWTIELGKGPGATRGCFELSCPTEFPSASEPFVYGAYTPLQYVCLGAGRKVRLSETCEASRWVAVYQRDLSRDPFVEPRDGEPPVTVLTRGLHYAPSVAQLTCANPAQSFPSGAASSGDRFACSDSWAVRLRRVP